MGFLLWHFGAGLNLALVAAVCAPVLDCALDVLPDRFTPRLNQIHRVFYKASADGAKTNRDRNRHRRGFYPRPAGGDISLAAQFSDAGTGYCRQGPGGSREHDRLCRLEFPRPRYAPRRPGKTRHGFDSASACRRDCQGWTNRSGGPQPSHKRRREFQHV